MYQKKDFFFPFKNEPHLLQLSVVMAHRNYCRQNNQQILKLATYTKVEDRYFGCKLVTL